MDDTRCPVCFCDFEDGDATHRLGCGHVFHVDCILSWAQSDAEMHASCPVCRFSEHQESNRQLEPVWSSTLTKSNFEPVLRVLRATAQSFNENERLLFECLERDLAKAEQRESKHRTEQRAFSKQNRKVIERARRFQRAQWSINIQVQRARRTLLAMFPVVTVVVPRAARATRRAPIAVRRSERLRATDAQGAGDAGA